MKLLACALFTTLSISLYAQTDSTQTEAYHPMVDYANPRQYVINDIKISGIQSFDPMRIASSAGIHKGDTVYVPGDYLSSALRKMWNLRYFSDVQILTETNGDMVDLEILLKERPKVTKWGITGVTKSDEKELIENRLKLRRGGELSDYVLSSARNLIYDYFNEKGYRNATVNVLQVNDPAADNAVQITFNVKKGSKVRIKKISFDGNNHYSDGKLRRSMKKTHQIGINIFQNTKFNAKDYEEDKERVVDYYNARGYRDAVILYDSIYPVNEKRIGINVTVEEGGKFYFRNISWTGNSVYSTEMLTGLLGIEKGDTYDKKGLYDRLGIWKESDPNDVSSVTSLYQNEGYIFSEVIPEETVVESDSVDVEIKIFEGKQASVNEVNISGSMRVNDDVIRREFYIRPGELYSRALIMQTSRQLMQMDHFVMESTFPGDIRPVGDDRVNLTYTLEDKASDQVEISAGWAYGMFVGSVGLQLNNFSTRNFFKKGAWAPYPAGQNQKLHIRGQTNGSYYKALSMNFVEPWLGGKKPNSFSTSLFYSDENDAYYAWQAGRKHFRTLGANVGLGKRLVWPDRNFTIYGEVGFQAYMLKDWEYFLISNGSSKVLSFKTVLQRTSINNPMYPSRGSDFSIALTLTPPYSLFQKNIDYTDPNLSSNQRFGWIEYHKWRLKAQWYHPLSMNEKLVLMAKAEMGYIGAYNKNKRSPFEGFDVGGDGMSTYTIYGMDIVGLRGYANGALTPMSTGNNEYARAFNKYTVELRYPLMMTGQQMIYMLAFVEGGNGFRSWQDFDPFLIKRSAGLGVRIYLPFLGLIGFDWGYGFDKNAAGKKSGGQPHFIIGMEF